MWYTSVYTYVSLLWTVQDSGIWTTNSSYILSNFKGRWTELTQVSVRMCPCNLNEFNLKPMSHCNLELHDKWKTDVALSRSFKMKCLGKTNIIITE